MMCGLRDVEFRCEDCSWSGTGEHLTGTSCKCPDCDGEGTDCDICNGSGRVCARCNGDGEINKANDEGEVYQTFCPVCRGKKEADELRTAILEIAEGV